MSAAAQGVDLAQARPFDPAAKSLILVKEI
jgi:hypothetical protein